MIRHYRDMNNKTLSRRILSMISRANCTSSLNRRRGLSRKHFGNCRTRTRKGMTPPGLSRNGLTWRCRTLRCSMRLRSVLRCIALRQRGTRRNRHRRIVPSLPRPSPFHRYQGLARNTSYLPMISGGGRPWL